MSNLTNPPILDDTGQDILSALGDIKRNLPQGGGTNGYAPTDATETTIADDDKMPFYDTSASGKRNSTWANIKAKLKAYFDGFYARNLYYDELYEPTQYNTNTHKFWGKGVFNCSLEGAPNKFTDFADAIVTATNDHANTIAKLRVELTLAEFNALTPAEQDDPEIVYYITDKPSLGYPVQDDGTATDLTDGALATGRTIESVMRKPYVISSANVVITGTHYGTFSLWSNGMKSFHIQDGSFPTGLIQPTGAVIPDAYVPTGNHYRGCGWTNDYSSTSANIQRVRCFTIGTDKKFYPYTGTGTGFFATAFYN